MPSAYLIKLNRLKAYLLEYKEHIIQWIKGNQRESAGLAFFLFMFLLGNYTIFAKKSSERPTTLHLPVLMKTAEGLSKGAHVFSHGVRVGYVASLTRVDLGRQGQALSFQEAEQFPSYGQGIIAMLNLQRDFIFYPNYRIITKHRTILAEKIIEILPGDGAGWDTRALPGNAHTWPESLGLDLLQAVPVLYLDYGELRAFHDRAELPRKGHLLQASNYDDPLYLFAAVLGENRKNLFYIFRNLNDISDKINRGTGTIGAVINQPDIANKTNEFLKQLIYFTHDVRDGAEALRESDSTVRTILALYGAYTLWRTISQ